MNSLMRPNSRTVASCLLVQVFVLGACGPSELATAEGMYIDYHWEPELTPCGGEAAALDEAVPWIGAQLDLEERRYPENSYSWISDETFEELYGTLRYAGRAERNGAYARVPTLIHEIAHLVDFRWRKRGPAFFIEGLAVAFTPQRYYEYLSPRLDPRPYIDGPLPEDLSFYPAAGSFVTYLLGRFGPRIFRDFTESLGSRASGAEIREACAEIYGEDLDTFVDEYLAASECPENALPVPQPLSCGAPRVPWVDAETWLYARSIECAADDVQGGYGGAQDQATVYRTLEIPADGTYTLTFYGDRDVTLTLEPCGACPWLELRHVFHVGERLEVPLRAGLHTFVLSTEATSSALVGVILTPVHD